jgi:hypothetical protein
MSRRERQEGMTSLTESKMVLLEQACRPLLQGRLLTREPQAEHVELGGDRREVVFDLELPQAFIARR